MCETFRQELQRDLATEPNVFRSINDTHSSATELLENAVVGDGLTDHRRILTGVTRQSSDRLATSGCRASAGLATRD